MTESTQSGDSRFTESASRISWNQRVRGMSGNSDALVEDIALEGAYRLGLLSLITAGVWLVVHILYRYLVPASGAEELLHSSPPSSMEEQWHSWVNYIGIALSLVMFAVTKWSRLRPSILLELGILYYIATGALVGVADGLYHVTAAGSIDMHGITWMSVWILAYPATVPICRFRVFLAAFIVASFDPIFAYQRVHAISGSFPEAHALLVWVPNYISAILAGIPAQILHRLRGKLTKARDLGAYTLVERIGQGGMGEVWRAQHRFLARPAAVKIIRSDAVGATDTQAARRTLRRFEREAQATAALESPHSVQLFDFGLGKEGTFYYVMELLNGFSLDSFVRKFGPMDSARVVQLLLQACDSLQDAHDKNLIHRDIKPANLFLVRRGLAEDFVKVLDFGLVKADRAHTFEDSLNTGSEITTGTPAFMAPEQTTGNREIDARADLYALGCVAYWLLTGRLVFEGDSPVEILASHLRDEVTPPSKLSEMPIDGDLERIVMSLLEKSPDKRPQSARELANQLEASSLAQAWTPELAGRWWQRHAPAGVHEPVPNLVRNDPAIA